MLFRSILAQPAYLVRVAEAQDAIAVFALLSSLKEIYPGADVWLARTWQEVLVGDATCRVAATTRDIVGVLIEKPKPDGRRKLCSLFVSPEARRQGVGEALVQSSVASWRIGNVDAGYITARRGRSAELRRLLRQCGFRHVATHLHRYGFGEHEDILEWRNDTKPGALDPPPSRRGDLRANEAL